MILVTEYIKFDKEGIRTTGRSDLPNSEGVNSINNVRDQVLNASVGFRDS